MALQFKKLDGYHQAQPNIEIVEAMFSRMNNTQATVYIYEDGYMAIDYSSMYYYYDHTDHVEAPFVDSSNANVLDSEGNRPLIQELWIYDPRSRHSFPVFVGNIFVLPQYDETDGLTKGNYPSDRACTVLPQPKDPKNFVLSWVAMHATLNLVTYPNQPDSTYDGKYRNMTYWTAVLSPLYDDTTGALGSKYQDIGASHVFFRQFYRLNAFRDQTGGAARGVDKQNSDAVVIM